MGCVASRVPACVEPDSTSEVPLAKSAAPLASRGDSPRSTTLLEPPSAGETCESVDDLCWVPSASVEVTPAQAILIEKEAVLAARPVAPIQLQVQLDSGWRDCSEEEAREVSRKLTKGEVQFTMHARGQNYIVDFTNPECATQMNVSTGRKRPLRVLVRDDTFPKDDFNIIEKDSSQKSLQGIEVPKTRRSSVDQMTLADISRQLGFGPQSRRGGATDHPFKVLEGNAHAKECFRRFAQNENKLCGEWAVFYHSYSFAALIYEVQAAVGSVLFRFRSQYAPLPRLLVKDFGEIPDAHVLVDRFQNDFANNKRDHHPSFRRVAVSCMCSLSSTGPEACTAMVFIAGYSCKDLSFRTVLENLLESCYVPKNKVRELACNIIKLSEKHGLDVSQFGGKPCQSGKAGHLLQVFVKRPLVDKLAYAAKPYGIVDDARMPISEYANSNRSFQVGQARLVAHPKYFMRADCVRMYVASADPTFHANRKEFQKGLVELLSPILGDPALRQSAACGIYGGSLPPWWSADDQRHHQNY